MRIAAVTGATGYVGRFVTPALQAHDWHVRALARPASLRGGYGAAPEWIEGDLGDAAALARLVSGAQAVVHLAYSHIPGRYRGGEGDDLAGWIEANLTGSLRLLMAAQSAGVERFVFLSSRAVFSQTLPGRVLDESHPVSPGTHYGAYKVAVESFLQSFAATSDMRCCAVRATGVYGATWPIERSKWWTLIDAIMRDSEIAGNGGGTEVHGGGTEVHGADVARVVCHWLEAAVPRFDVIHLSDGWITQREVVRLARTISGKPGPLPVEPGAPPANPLVCRRIEEMGLRLGGSERLRATVAELVEAATARAAGV